MAIGRRPERNGDWEEVDGLTKEMEESGCPGSSMQVQLAAPAD